MNIQDEPSANSGFLPASTYFVESGDFIRLNNVTLSYTLPKSMISKIKIENAKIFVTGQNLITLQKFTGFTPELPDSSPTKSGIELNAYPTTRTFAGGVNISFKMKKTKVFQSYSKLKNIQNETLFKIISVFDRCILFGNKVFFRFS
ncbi:MAG: hypothetical protein IPK25_05700 [Saprospiraceae bacterium]|nr:hypothetical protein [Saprospiraceae bacterium]